MKSKITFTIVTKKWTEGNVCDFEILSSSGCRFVVDWGDGKSEVYEGKDTWIKLYHHFPGKDFRMELAYDICVHAEDVDDIVGFSVEYSEVNYKNLTTGDCPSLAYLKCVGIDLTAINIDKNSALKELDCSGNKLTDINLTQNQSLERLDCSNNLLTSLDLTRCNNLKWLNCSHNPITKLRLSNHSALSIAIYEQTDIKGNAEAYLRKIVGNR